MRRLRVPKLRYEYRVKADAVRRWLDRPIERWTIAYSESQAETFVLRQLEREWRLPLKALKRDDLLNCKAEQIRPVVSPPASSPKLF